MEKCIDVACILESWGWNNFVLDLVKITDFIYVMKFKTEINNEIIK